MANDDQEKDEKPTSAQASEVTLVGFNTADIEPRYRYDVWRENMGSVFDVSSIDGSRPNLNTKAAMGAVDLGDTLMVETNAESQLFVRSEKRVTVEELGLILIQFYVKGEGHILGHGTVSPRDMMIVDSEQPIEVATTDYSNLTLFVPRDLKEEISPAIEELHGRVFDGRDPMIELLREHFQALWRTLPKMTQVQASASIRGAIGLLRGWISADGRLAEELSPVVSAALKDSVRQYIEQHLNQPMRVEDLARRFRVSRSQLYLMFAPYNGVASYIRERRLQRSRRMLTSPRFLHQSIGAIGFDNGFASESQFSRAFRARFAVTPRQVRDEMRVLLRNNPGSVSSADSKEYPDDIRGLVKKLAMFSGAESRT